MTVERLFPSGAYAVRAVVDGYLRSRVYYGYTRAEAVREFRLERKMGACPDCGELGERRGHMTCQYPR